MDGAADKPARIVLGTALGALAGALGGVPIVAAVRAHQPVWSAFGSLAFPLVLFWIPVGSLTVVGVFGLPGAPSFVSSRDVWGLYTYFLLYAYLPCAGVAGLLTWTAYTSR